MMPSPARNGHHVSRPAGFWRGRLSLGAAVLLVILVAHLALVWIEATARTDVQHRLTAVLETADKALQYWAQEKTRYTRFWGENPDLVHLATPLLGAPHAPAPLMAHPAQAELRAFLEPIVDGQHFTAARVIAPDGIIVAATEDARIGQTSRHARPGEFLRAALAGRTVLIFPRWVSLPQPFADVGAGTGRVQELSVAAPLRTAEGSIIGVLEFHINASHDFSLIPQLAQLGNTGETYAFDPTGRLLSESRFQGDLRRIGLLGPEESSILAVELRDPGVNLLSGARPDTPRHERPLTYAVTRAVAGVSGVDVEGFPDYRGVPVVSAWTWDETLWIGLVTQQDAAEAYQTLTATKHLVWTIVGTTVVLLLGLPVVQTRTRQRALARHWRAERSGTEADGPAQPWPVEDAPAPARRAGPVRRLLPSSCVLVVGVAASLGAYHQMRQGEQARRTAHLQRLSATHAAHLQREIARRVETLRAIRGLYDASEVVTRAEFSRFIQQFAPGFTEAGTFFGWFPRVSASDRPAFESALRHEWRPDFEIRDMMSDGTMRLAAARQEYFPAAYVEAEAGNAWGCGWDLMCDEAHRQAVSRARDTDRPVATERILFHEVSGGQVPGFMAYVPVYAGGRTPGDVPSRRARMCGIVGGVFHLHEIVDTVFPPTAEPSELDLYLYDLGAPPERRLLFVRAAPAGGVVGEALSEREARAGVCFEHELQVADRQWSVVFRPADPGMLLPSRAPRLILGLGLALTGLLVVYVHSSLRRRDRVEELVEERTAELGIISARLTQDIRDRQRAEEALRASEIQTRAVVEFAADALITIQETGVILSWNPAAERMFGWPASDAIGRHVGDLVVPTDAHAAHRRGLDAYQEHGIGALIGKRTEVIARRRDGSTFAAELAITMMTVNGATRFLGLVQDISARKDAEEERIRLATAIEQAAESIVITDTAGVVEYVNPAFEQISGYPSAEVVGHTLRMLKSGKHDDAFYQELRETISTGSVWRGHLVSKRKDGSLYEEDAVISPVRDEMGRIVRYVVVKNDVTERVKLEAQYRQAQKMEAVGTLAGGIAHDFNNLLTSILGNTELVRMLAPPNSPIAEKLARIRESAERAAELTHQLLTLSRKQEPVMGALDVHEVVLRATRLLEHTIPESIGVRTIFNDAIPVIRGDAGQLEHALLNLAINARDAMPEGGTLTLETGLIASGAMPVEVSGARPAASYATIDVRDTGHGIPAELCDRIFEPFFTTKRAGEGTGLGLAMVHSCMDAHGGAVTVESHVGTGTTFRLYLPVVLAPAVATPRARPEDLPSGTETLLLVDDQESVLHVLRNHLELRGYTVLLAADGEQAFSQVTSHNGDVRLVVTDLVMPRMGGRELLQRLRASGYDIPVLAVSGYAADVRPEELRAEGFADFVAKPFDAGSLLTAIRDALDGS